MWGIGGSVELQTVGTKSSFEQWAATNCIALPNASAGQYATSIVNCCSSGFPVSSGIYIYIRSFTF